MVALFSSSFFIGTENEETSKILSIFRNISSLFQTVTETKLTNPFYQTVIFISCTDQRLQKTIIFACVEAVLINEFGPISQVLVDPPK